MPFPKKALPKPSLTLVAHPERDGDYTHFEHSIDVPFDAAATGFSRVNAWWLADASLLSYWDPVVATARFRDLARLESRLVEAKGTACYVAFTGAFVLVAFRGTESDSLLDMVTNVQIPFAAWDVAGERVHTGFKGALENIWPPLLEALNALGPRPVWFTGHSLGGALAALAGDRFARLQPREFRGTYTFGSPLVGDRTFVEGFNQRCGALSFRFVNDQDAITRVPPPLLGYGHVNNEHVVGFNDPGVSFGEPLIDHTPRRYAVLVWNALVDAALGSPGGG